MPKSNTRGMLDLEGLHRLVEADEIDTVIVAFTDLYGRLMGKRLDGHFFLEGVSDHGVHACDYLLAVDMEMEPVPGYRFANWEKGYGDFRLLPDLATLRRVSWLDKTALVICDVQDDKMGGPVAPAPRSILGQQLKVAQQAGYQVMAGSELEYYLFRNSYREAAAKGYSGLEPAGWYLEDYNLLQGSREEDFNGAVRRHLNDSGIPVESSKGEWGLGQHEVNIRYADVLTTADRHCLYKQCLKEVADQMGSSVSFMAKFDSERAGSSCHLHLSLWRGETNVFPGDTSLGPLQCSDTFRWFLGGWMAHLPEFMVCYAPNVNSYKRYQSGSWAPTRVAWSHDNRTSGFRVIGSGSGLRIECRVPGADCNPYLAYAASLASGLDGLARKLEPPEITEGNVYTSPDRQRVPGSLREAVELFAESSFTREAFGDEVVDHYAHFCRTEQEAYDRAVSDWERKRYFERI